MKAIPEEIKIIRGDHGWNVIIDGRIVDSLCWDEMVGTIAQATLTGEIRYGSFPIGDPNRARRWINIPKQITQGKGVFTV